MKPSEISAVILAAGYSSRMGFFKPLSMLDGRVALEWAVRSVTGAGIGDVVVVTGFRREETEICAVGAGARPIFNSEDEGKKKGWKARNEVGRQRQGE